METVDDKIETEPRPNCYLCGGPGSLRYRGLRDSLFGAPGAWDLRQCDNPVCELGWLDPMPAESEIGKAYRQYFTHGEPTTPDSAFQRLQRAVHDGSLRKWSGYAQGVGPPWRRRLAPLAGILPGGRAESEARAMFLQAQRPGASLLDVGCGDGAKLIHMRDLGWDVEGVDTDRLAVELARARNLVARVGTLAEQRYPDGRFDAVHMSHVIEHVHDPVALLAECHRILKPDGVLVVLTPNLSGWGHAKFRSDWRGLEPPRHLHLFAPKSLASTLRLAGFESATIRSVAANARYILSMSIALRDGRRSGNRLAPKRKLAWRARGALLQYWERALVQAQPTAGDEVLAVGRKRPAPAAER
jgi:2-polyprenyl-3-methyl-5-hydroxy-6-metoxy-1,4-benzoquinol methylase